MCDIWRTKVYLNLETIKNQIITKSDLFYFFGQEIEVIRIYRKIIDLCGVRASVCVYIFMN